MEVHAEYVFDKAKLKALIDSDDQGAYDIVSISIRFEHRKDAAGQTFFAAKIESRLGEMKSESVFSQATVDGCPRPPSCP